MFFILPLTDLEQQVTLLIAESINSAFYLLSSLEADPHIFRFQDFETSPDSFYDYSPSLRENAVPLIIDNGKYSSTPNLLVNVYLIFFEGICKITENNVTFILLQVCPRCHYHADSTQNTLVLSTFKLKNYDQDSLLEQSIVLFYFF